MGAVRVRYGCVAVHACPCMEVHEGAGRVTLQLPAWVMDLWFMLASIQPTKARLGAPKAACTRQGAGGLGRLSCMAISMCVPQAGRRWCWAQSTGVARLAITRAARQARRDLLAELQYAHTVHELAARQRGPAWPAAARDVCPLQAVQYAHRRRAYLHVAAKLFLSRLSGIHCPTKPQRSGGSTSCGASPAASSMLTAAYFPQGREPAHRRCGAKERADGPDVFLISGSFHV